MEGLDSDRLERVARSVCVADPVGKAGRRAAVNYLSSQDEWASLSLQRVAMAEAVEPGCSVLHGETSPIWSGAASPAPVIVGTAV